MEKLNIAEMLKDCPSGMELNCVTYDNVSFDKVSVDEKSVYPIFCYITDEKGNRSGISFTENGCESKRYGAKCVIFPKGKTTWEGFQRPFKEGDIVATLKGNQIFIFKENIKDVDNSFSGVCYFGVELGNGGMFKEGRWHFTRLANEEEKQKLFDAIKANGYRWNPETKTLEKLIVPKFKVGDKIEKCTYSFTIVEVKEDYYLTKGGNKIPIENQMENFEFKSQICTTKPQSEALLALGLKKETADMVHYFSQSLAERWVIVPLDNGEVAENNDLEIPAWSLHRLMEMLALCQYEIYPLDNVYEDIIYIIEEEIKGGYFNKDYLEERK